jgi:hypothetical protein
MLSHMRIATLGDPRYIYCPGLLQEPHKYRQMRLEGPSGMLSVAVDVTDPH